MVLNDTLIFYLDIIILFLISIFSCQQLFYSKFNCCGIFSILLLSIYIAIHTYKSGINIFIFIAFICAIILIILEMFLPVGIMGVLGTIILLYSLVSLNEEVSRIIFIITISIILFVAWYLFNIYILKNKPLFLCRLILEYNFTTDKGYVAKESNKSILNKKLLSLTDLRPSGIAILENQKYDVVTEGEYIEKNNYVIVTKVEGMRIVVRKI